jgi:hypothetical protein
MMLAAFLLLAAPVVDGLEAGFNLLYHLQFSDARAVFSRWRQTHPENPMGPASEAASHIFEEFERHGVLTTAFFLNDDTLLGGIKGKPDPARMKAFHNAANDAQRLGAAVLKSNPTSADALLAVAISAGMQADAAALVEKRPVVALRRVREAESFGNKLLAAHPGKADAYMAMGMASYIIGSMPAYKRAIIWFGGISGDKARGMRQLEIAAQHGHYLKAYAKIMLALACLREKQGPRALTLLNELSHQFPQSPLFIRERPVFELVARYGEPQIRRKP